MGPETNPSTVTEAIARLRVDRDDLARSLTETYFADHPEFESEHPPQARLRTREDFGYLVDFLVGALAAGNPATFVDMVLWTAHVLENRRIPRPVLVDSLHRIEREITSRYAEPMAAQATRYLAIGVGALNLPAGATPIKAAAMPQLDHASRIYLQAILQGDRQAALSVASEALASGTRIADVYLNMIQTSMYEVGRRWEANQITVADEHLATAITQWVLAQLYDRLDIPNPHRGRVIVTGIEGELHQVGANMVADMLESDGWNVRFLGANVPHQAVLQSIDDHEASVLGISTTMLIHLPNVDRLVADAKQRFGSDLRVIVGGAAFRGDPGLAERIGADAFARDLNGAVETLRNIA
jgi:methanogenic corrinoid protein MtbC1